MKKILSVILGLALCCMLAALPVCAEETAAPVQAEAATGEIGDGYVTLVSDSDQLIPVYVDEEAEGAAGTVEQAMADFSVGGTIMGLINDSGIYDIIKGNWKSAVMILISFVLLYLAIVKQFEPLLLMPIAFGMLLTNLPLAGIMDEPIYEIISNPTYHGKAGIPIWNGDTLVGYQYIKQNGGLLYYLYQGVKLGIFPPLIFMGVGATAKAETFLQPQTLKIIAMGVFAFGGGTAGGVLLGDLMCKLSGGKINPLIGSAGVSAVPMAARVSQKVGQAENPSNFLLMHAMGPNVAGVIGSAVAAGVFISMFG